MKTPNTCSIRSTTQFLRWFRTFLFCLFSASLMSCDSYEVGGEGAESAHHTLPNPATLDTAGKGSSSGQTPTGFFYPVGTTTPTITTPWLALGCSSSTDYLSHEYHLGADLRAGVGEAVRAISDGKVVRISQNGWGSGNVAIVIRHSLANDIEFLAFYGHVRNQVNEGDSVTQGQTIATVGTYSGGSHLHFGIHLGLSLPSSRWGKMACSSWPSTNGMVEPLSWILVQQPKRSSTTNSVDDVALADMAKFASGDSRFGAYVSGTLERDLDWSPHWELRSAQYSFSAGRRVRVFHATSKSDSKVRYVTYLDPDSGSWFGWRRM